MKKIERTERIKPMGQTAEKQRVNILMVDDSPAKLLSYEAILGELDENLIKAASAREAFEILLRTDVAVVLVDVCMPDLDGFELAAMIRQHPRFQRTAIILVSAVLINEMDRMRGYSSGAMDYLPVPVVPEILRAKVSVFIELYRQGRELESLNRELERRVAERTAELEASAAQLRESEEALRVADQRKDEFLAVLAHELRNPLAPIRNAARFLQLHDVCGTDVDARWNVDVIDRQVNHLTRLIDDLLDISRINRGRLELRRSRITLAEAVRSALESSRLLIDQNGHELSIELPGEQVYLDGDLVRLAQVFTNLFNNAAKYTPAGGSIRLEGRVIEGHGGEVEVVVRDSGVGIAEDELPRLFEMFVQLPGGRHRAESGLGIGLALVRHLVRLHGGSVEARSAGPGRGSEFVVRLPTLTHSDRLPQSSDGSPASAESARRRILVVDDMLDNATSLAILLRRIGNEVEVATSGLQAVAAAERFRPQFVLLDIGMPDIDGFEACRRIRAHDWGADMVIVALTGWGQEDDRRRAAEAGFDAHLVKPVEHSTLVALLADPPARAPAR